MRADPAALSPSLNRQYRETSDWRPPRSVFACIRFARKRSNSGDVVLSCGRAARFTRWVAEHIDVVELGGLFRSEGFRRPKDRSRRQRRSRGDVQLESEEIDAVLGS